LLSYSDLENLSSFGAYYVYAKPDGERCLITTRLGKTIARNEKG